MRFASALATVVVLGSTVLLAPGSAQAAAPQTIGEYQKWYYDDYLKIPEVQKAAGSKGAGVTIALIDSGVDTSRPDLRGADLRDGGGYGNSGAGKSGLEDAGYHGTVMAGILVGQGTDDSHVKGIAPEATLLSISVGLESQGKTTHSEAIRAAVDQGADIINMSITRVNVTGDLTFINPLDREAAEYALSKGVIIVAGAGNAETTGPVIGPPANIPGVLAVSGLDKDGGFWSGGARGPEAGIAAPAVDIFSVQPEGYDPSGYGTGTGTSAATAIVSGVAALIKAKHPDLDAANLINRLTATARDEGAPGRDDQFGFGAIDALAAVNADVPAVTENPAGDPMDGVAGDTAAEAEEESPLARYLWVLIAAAVAVVLLIVVIAVVTSRRKRPAAPVTGYPPPGHQPPGHQPPVYQPPGYPQQPPPPPPPGYR
ncbi:type VII secretion-associated serine protease mycosin [Catenuloplanes nepalensis]|uniref:Type VII secretion-associated serine protease mycosin n=1 Tax=Catenuloplanes nepalensis TaxID=587533 RepID=A0ABT9N254_9ACTN|nr:S8 family serine peptidase [Catenuloplanes nepalensis]MDP9797583.1 type VII secretion-associated serine protease mycosin [Catenuloplanes nepalensis]